MDRQTLRDWVHRFNEEGPDGLTNRKGAGRTRYLSDVQMKELGEIVETGPDPAVDGVVRWRRNSTRSKTSGPTCAPTNSPSPSSTVTTTSSRSAATRGTSSPKTKSRRDRSKHNLTRIRKKRHSIRPLV